MSEKEVKASEKKNTNGMPTDSEAEEPTEVLLAMLYTAAKALEKREICEVLTGHSPKSRNPVTYIRLPMVEVDKLLGFRTVGSSINPLAEVTK